MEALEDNITVSENFLEIYHLITCDYGSLLCDTVKLRMGTNPWNRIPV